MSNQVDISVLIVNWNCGQVILNCVASLIATIKEHSYEIIIVDNDSKDGSVENILKRYPFVTVIRNKHNNMFAGANNQGYAISRGKYILVLNPDTVVPECGVDNLARVLEDGNEEVITCTLLNSDGSVQYGIHRGFPSSVRLLCAFLYAKSKKLSFLPPVRNYFLLDNDFNSDFSVFRKIYIFISFNYL